MSSAPTRSPTRRESLVRVGTWLTAAALGAACGAPYVHDRKDQLGGRGPTEAPLRAALRWAVTAPSAHNTQPWLFHQTSAHEATLYVDTDRWLPHTDPRGRQIVMSHGTLIEAFCLAATTLGHSAHVATLPEGDVSFGPTGLRPTAHLRLEPSSAVTPAPLAAALGRRRTSRLPHDGPPPDDAAVRRIVAALTGPGVSGDILRDGLGPLLELAVNAMRIEVETPTKYAESLRWFRFTADEVARRGDGLNLQMMGTDGLAARLFFGPEGWFEPANRERFLNAFAEAVASTRSLLVLATPTDDAGAWLEAGRAYLRAQLEAETLGLGLHPLSQALQEFSEMSTLRRAMATRLGASGHVQMLARLGRTEAPAYSPRRPVEAMLRA
jgi:hypothetical protein